MKSFLFAIALSFMATATVACGGAAQQVEVKGAEPELQQLVGDWEGSYTGVESGRSGPVSFSLALGRHTADGTVLMGGETPLQIQFVSIEGGQISGKIAPYTDPRCSCEVVTEFVGTVVGDAITGSFVTRVQGQEQRGEWSVTRKSS